MMKVTMSIAVGTFVVLFLQLETPMAQPQIQPVLLIFHNVSFTCSNSSFSFVPNQHVMMETRWTDHAGVMVMSIRPALLVSTQFKMVTNTAPAKVGFSQHVNLAFRC